MKSMQYLAEDAANDESRARTFSSLTSAVIKDLFSPSPSHSTNEQASVLLGSLGWRNANIQFSSGTEARIVLGSNRHLEQDQNSVNGLILLVSSICKALGYHILSREVDAVVDIEIINGPIYTVDLKAIQSQIVDTTKEEPVKQKPVSAPASSSTSAPASTPPPAEMPGTKIDTSQIFLPILSSKLPIGRLHLILQDILAEFSKSWYGSNPIEGNESPDERDNVIQLMMFLVQKTLDSGAASLDSGTRLGGFFAKAVKEAFNMETPLAQEIIDGAGMGSMIRDIKARAFCSLRPGDKCGPNIGDENRSICDFSMGIWQGALSEFTGKNYKFNGFYPAGKRDPYCLMEFEVN